MFKIKNIDHIVLTTQNLQKCLDFYQNILNMQLDSSNNRYALKFGNQKINIHQQKGEFQPAALAPTYGSLDLCFIVEDILQVKSEIEAKNYPIELGIVERTGATSKLQSIYLRDPDGNLIELASKVKS